MPNPVVLGVHGGDRSWWIEAVQGDIALVSADAIVTAANEYLAGGSGVDEAIRFAAGPAVDEEISRRDLRCATGAAVITGSGDLARRGVKWIVHAVGPVWQGGGEGERESLALTYASALSVASAAGANTVAMPAISCGAFGFPADIAARIALDATQTALGGESNVECVRFVLLDPDVFKAFRREIATRSSSMV